MQLRSVQRIRGLLITFLAVVSLGLAGCSAPVRLGNVFGGDETPAKNVTPGSIAFEPVVGLPENLATQLAAELGTAAVGQRLTVLGRDDPKAALRAKGYFTATTELSQTRIGYVWDLFDAAGQRKQRFEGQQVVGRIANDPWSVADSELLATIAEWTITQIAASSNTRAEAPATPSGSSSVLAMNTLAQADAPPLRTWHPRFAIDKVKASTSDGSKTLPVALGEALQETGAVLASESNAATHVVTGEATVSPDSGGMDKVTLVWTLADMAGHRLGSVRQEKKVPKGALASTWSGHIEDAAKAAAPSIIALALPNS
ncbi:MAG: hypothetical protein KDJ55_05920 [Rhodobiaceae bacterium]|nr:hypothetical protein [Rhodobiaceae bacterium]MCC0011813.1 hypothetical protein [Rhodobiaceae bacterium]MCC0050530.1 hypothetical protein [Rhodobiaceae bacterium]MCC0061269.1 hypothetical protein [Rhodobiaceae bacterium]